MAYIPEDAKWYLAEIVEVIEIADEQEKIVNINFMLVRADSPEEAYEKAMELGRDVEISYDNTDGKLVTCRFQGLKNLYVIHDELEHGAEILYERVEGLQDNEIQELVRRKEDLNIFKED